MNKPVVFHQEDFIDLSIAELSPNGIAKEANKILSERLTPRFGNIGCYFGEPNIRLADDKHMIWSTEACDIEQPKATVTVDQIKEVQAIWKTLPEPTKKAIIAFFGSSAEVEL